MNSIEFGRFNCLSPIQMHAFTTHTQTHMHAYKTKCTHHTQTYSHTQIHAQNGTSSAASKQQNEEEKNTKKTWKHQYWGNCKRERPTDRTHMHLIKLTAAAASRRNSRSTAVERSCDIDWVLCVSVRLCVWNVGFDVCVPVHMYSEFEWMVAATATAIQQQQRAANKQNEWTCVCEPYYALYSVALLSHSLSLCVFSILDFSLPTSFSSGSLHDDRPVSIRSSKRSHWILHSSSSFPLKREANTAQDIAARTHSHSSKLGTLDVRPFCNQHSMEL